MTYKTITASIAPGYSLSSGSSFTGVYVDSGVSIGGFGVILGKTAGIKNDGTISANRTPGDYGVLLTDGGTVQNYSGAFIGGYEGIVAGGGKSVATAVSNRGFITAYQFGVELLSGGYVNNETGAIISVGNDPFAPDQAAIDIGGAGGTVVNSGALISAYGTGINVVGGTVTNFGQIGAPLGIYSAGVATVVNTGTISSANGSSGNLGVELGDGGIVTNGGASDTSALIFDNLGVLVSAATLENFGTINSYNNLYYGGDAVLASDGSQITNGSAKDRTALIEGGAAVDTEDVLSNVANFGTILASSTINPAVYLYGGTLTNGSGVDTSALLMAYRAVVVADRGSVTNFGTIHSTMPTANTYAYGDYGVLFIAGGTLVNGSSTSRTALIEGYGGVEIQKAIPGAVRNFGTILALGDEQFGVDVYYGSVTNGGRVDQTALIQGASGVKDAGVVQNFGTINATGAYGYGVQAATNHNFYLTNGSAGDRNAQITGATGVSVTVNGILVNFATITGVSYSGVVVAGGTITNGGGPDRSALIEGGADGVLATANSLVRNFGTLAGASYGAYLRYGGYLANGSLTNTSALVLEGGRFSNGSAGHGGAVVEGYGGVETILGAIATVINYGTIVGLGGVAVSFDSSGDLLGVAAGSSFVGAVEGGGGTLDLISGVGTLTGLLSAAGDVTVSGSMATTTFTGFGTVEVGGGSFTTAGGTIAAAQGLDVAGTLTTTGTLTVAGTLTTSGTLTGTGVLALTGGKATFDTGTSLTIAKVTQSGANVATVADASLTYAGAWTQTAGTISVATGAKITFTGVGDSFSGTLAGTGIVALTAGSDTLSGTTISVTDMDIDAATTLSGTITASASVFVTTPSITVAATGATLTGGGAFYLSNIATNEIEGASAAATLTNVSDRIDGAGLLGGGQMVLVNDTAGLIAGNQALGLTINTGTSTITNAGVIEDTGAGGTTIVSNLDNTGTLQSLLGTLTVEGTVTGAGVIHIASGAADFTSTTAALAENVTFTGTTGVLELANSQHFTGTVSGFSKTGTTSLDLRDITFTSGTTKATYSGTTTSGVLTVTTGSEVAHITLEGNYTTSTFTPSSDGHGGTTIVDPTAPAAGAPSHIAPIQPLVAAMASLAAGGGEVVAVRLADWRAVATTLAGPRPVLI